MKMPVSKVFDAEKQTIPLTWFPLKARASKTKSKVFGEILLTIALYGRENYNRFLHQDAGLHRNLNGDNSILRESLELTDSPARNSDVSSSSYGSGMLEEGAHVKEDKSNIQSFAGKIISIFTNKIADNVQKSAETPSQEDNNSEESDVSEKYCDCEDTIEEEASDEYFEEGFDSTEVGKQEIPSPLPGGILLDQSYNTSPRTLNSILFGPKSQFKRDLTQLEGTTNYVEGPWRKAPGEPMKRVVTYIKAATKLVKAVKATEEHTYLRADGKVFIVLESVSTPDVPYGSSFRVELLFCITPGPELPSGEETSHLSISWRINFLQSTIMRGMIESGARQGLKDSFQQYAQLLSQNVTPLNSALLSSDSDLPKLDLQTDPQPDWKLVVSYIGVYTLASTLLAVVYVLLHIFFTSPSTMQGLEFGGLDLPDSFGEVLTCGLIVLQVERVLKMISHFMHARFQKAGDHGIKAQGDGWLLTVALVEGKSLAAVDATGYSDPYVIFTCNGKTRTSSIKLQTLDPQWHEIFEYDATEEPPSVMDVEVFDFEGPFAEATSLGFAEINFLKFTPQELGDLWIPLQGRLAQACQSKLHLRIFLTNTKGPDVITQYITKMEKEVGKKIARRSPQTNSTFQKLFGLPPEEFLINDFSCYLKRKMPLQGRLFLSARMLGFYANLFGHKTKFSFLWEDIEEIKELAPSLASMGSPSLVIFLRKGRGLDAIHGAKNIDDKGRHKFYFQSFVSYNNACRTIMALWRNRALSLEQKMQIVDDEEPTDSGDRQNDDSGSFLGVEEASMTKVHSGTLPVSVDSFMELSEGALLDKKIMEKSGCLNYRTTPWEISKPKVFQRQCWYKFNRHVSGFGVGVTSTQQKSMNDNGNGWTIEEVLTLHGVPFGDHFQLHVRKEFEDGFSASEECNFRVYMGISWLKSTTFQKRITQNIFEKFTDHLKEITHLAEKEILAIKNQSAGT
ncbi:C2 and GRAM domain-containing protein At1g03370 isoform X2 [Cryptomeria japonica]|nr:C2 and GRAM domain-containing protein At1g03370 isoform X2 [Cryptomeria japonica]